MILQHYHGFLWLVTFVLIWNFAHADDSSHSSIQVLSISSKDSRVFFTGKLYCKYGCGPGDTLSFSGGITYPYSRSSISLLSISFLDPQSHESLLNPPTECSLPLQRNRLSHYPIPWGTTTSANSYVTFTGHLFFLVPQKDIYLDTAVFSYFTSPQRTQNFTNVYPQQMWMPLEFIAPASDFAYAFVVQPPTSTRVSNPLLLTPPPPAVPRSFVGSSDRLFAATNSNGYLSVVLESTYVDARAVRLTLLGLFTFRRLSISEYSSYNCRVNGDLTTVSQLDSTQTILLIILAESVPAGASLAIVCDKLAINLDPIQREQQQQQYQQLQSQFSTPAAAASTTTANLRASEPSSFSRDTWCEISLFAPHQIVSLTSTDSYARVVQMVNVTEWWPIVRSSATIFNDLLVCQFNITYAMSDLSKIPTDHFAQFQISTDPHLTIDPGYIRISSSDNNNNYILQRYDAIAIMQDDPHSYIMRQLDFSNLPIDRKTNQLPDIKYFVITAIAPLVGLVDSSQYHFCQLSYSHATAAGLIETTAPIQTTASIQTTVPIQTTAPIQAQQFHQQLHHTNISSSVIKSTATTSSMESSPNSQSRVSTYLSSSLVLRTSMNNFFDFLSQHFFSLSSIRFPSMYSTTSPKIQSFSYSQRSPRQPSSQDGATTPSLRSVATTQQQPSTEQQTIMHSFIAEANHFAASAEHAIISFQTSKEQFHQKLPFKLNFLGLSHRVTRIILHSYSGDYSWYGDPKTCTSNGLAVTPFIPSSIQDDGIPPQTEFEDESSLLHSSSSLNHTVHTHTIYTGNTIGFDLSRRVQRSSALEFTCQDFYYAAIPSISVTDSTLYKNIIVAKIQEVTLLQQSSSNPTSLTDDDALTVRLLQKSSVAWVCDPFHATDMTDNVLSTVIITIVVITVCIAAIVGIIYLCKRRKRRLMELQDSSLHQLLYSSLQRDDSFSIQ